MASLKSYLNFETMKASDNVHVHEFLKLLGVCHTVILEQTEDKGISNWKTRKVIMGCRHYIPSILSGRGSTRKSCCFIRIRIRGN